jgi:1-aminocyclopropane-1-carboxylate deaminase
MSSNSTVNLLGRLAPTPVLGQSFANVALLHLDLQGGSAPGNKWFKLQGNISHANQLGIKTLVSFGGAWSNHLHALAAIGRELGLQTIGIVRGEEPRNPSAMLCDAKRWGMKLVYVSRTEYRRRDEAHYIDEVRARYGPCLVIPEGGANVAGLEGCTAIADRLSDTGVRGSKIVLAVGTGTTLAGVARGLGGGSSNEVVGVSVLKGAIDLDARIEGMVGENSAPWSLLHDHHCGGYARVSAELREFILAFQAVHDIPLDPVYTGKAMYAVYQLLSKQVWSGNSDIVVIHTGGLQGRRGFAWLS